MNYLFYEDKPKYDVWIKVLLVGVVALTFILGIVQISVDTKEALTVFGTVLFEIILFRMILPRRFQILSDKLRIVLGGPFAINIPLSDIEEVRSRTGIKAFVYFGVRFATSSSHTVEIIRKKGLNMVISPTNDDEFIKQLNQARKAPSH
ncbi:PH domain-containing protein [Chloroflexota bacterium]